MHSKYRLYDHWLAVIHLKWVHTADCLIIGLLFSFSFSTESLVVRFDGSQHFTITPRAKVATVADDITLQFRTRHSHGALLNTRSKDRKSGLDIFLYLGKLYIQITIAGTEHVSFNECN